MSTQSLTLENHARQPIQKLFEDMYHDKWRFDDFTQMSVQENTSLKEIKQAGKFRQIQIANNKLKAWHNFLRISLLDFMPLNNDIVFSYRKHKGAYDAVTPHRASKSFFVCDIANFFPSINRARIRFALHTAKDLCPIENLEQYLDRIVDSVCIENSLPVGFSTSPPISNSVLFPFDNALQSYCDRMGMILTRYSDDIIVSSQNAKEMTGIQDIVTHTLRETMSSEFSLNAKKSRMLHRGNKIKLLGMVLLPNGNVSVDASVKSQIEVRFFFYLRDKRKFADMATGDAQKAEVHLAGLLNYVNTIDKNYIDSLRKKFGAAVVDYFLYRSFT